VQWIVLREREEKWGIFDFCKELDLDILNFLIKIVPLNPTLIPKSI